ncbi:MAG TPA: ClpXP protease specificity-enhancing factor, partial [Sedimenticola sp.]|nr:ClpXP protease specificity-enhancing factor [Sedimenticola sp.]
RALYEWLIDNGLTPHLLVDAERDDVVIPTAYVEEGRIVLNIGPSAVRGLDLGNDQIHFNARFGGTPMDVFIPPAAVLGIYARENGQGMLFPVEEADADADVDETPPPDDDSPPPRSRPSLKVVK